MESTHDIELHIIDAGTFLCDGGGIFGSVPKILWNRYIKADENNLIRLAMNCLLVVAGENKILIETGAGTKLSWKFIQNNGIENSDLLIDSLSRAGFSTTDITHVIHTHLHWDHCGGGTFIDSDKKIHLTFPKATYICSKAQWENANNANVRESDAYFDDDFFPILEQGKLQLIEQEGELFPGIDLRIFNGHTPGMIVPIITVGTKKVAYVNDLAPLCANVPLKWIAAYDLYPVIAMNEKASFFKEAFEGQYILCFEHDLQNECCSLKWDAQKGPLPDEKGSLDYFLTK
ncbi:MAG TPA: MBL fold metallo-hydrolase [Prolixibacteraceae bacterium]|nr:MBL fold metallo-hydrolase [Prolixibacteraceae bacterium]